MNPMARRKRVFEDSFTFERKEPPPKEAVGTALRRNNAVLRPSHIRDGGYATYIVRAGQHAEDFRDGDYLHVSDIIHKCSRMIALAKRYNVKLNMGQLPESAGLTFAMGRAIETYVRNKFKQNAADKLWGGWHCNCGKKTFEGTYEQARQQTVCQHCHTKPEHYIEMVIENDEYMFSGSIDITLLEGKALHLVEVKSIKHDNWKDLSRPIPEHLVQILSYWWLAKQAGYDVYDSVSILYCTKGYVMFGSPYKEFVLQPSKLMRRLEEFLEEAGLLNEAINNNGPIPIRVCQRPDQGEAKTCPMATICFQHPNESS